MFALKKENEDLMRELMVAQAQSVQSLAERDALMADLHDLNSKWISLTDEFEYLYAEYRRSEKEFERRIADEKQTFDSIKAKFQEEISQERKKAYEAEQNYRKAHSEMTNKNSEVAFLTLENATLKHDLEQSKQTCSKYLEENTKIKCELGRISKKDGALYEKFTEKHTQILQTISGFKNAYEKCSADGDANQASELKSYKEKLKKRDELCRRLQCRLEKMRRKIRKKSKSKKRRSSSRSSDSSEASSVTEDSSSSKRSARDATPKRHKSRQTGSKTPPTNRRREINIGETSSPVLNAKETTPLDPLTDAPAVTTKRRDSGGVGSSYDGYRWTVNSSTSEEEAGGATPSTLRVSSPSNSANENEREINGVKEIIKSNVIQSKKSSAVFPKGYRTAPSVTADRQPVKFKLFGGNKIRPTFDDPMELENDVAKV